MQKIFNLTPELRKEFKKPLGILISGCYDQTMDALARIIKDKKPEKIISVGDQVTRNIIRKKLPLDIGIVDNRVMRKPVEEIDFKAEMNFQVSNPAGTLTEESWHATLKAMEYEERVLIKVEGEEDLLVLFATLAAPNGALIVYGQPGEGIVVVEVNRETKEKFECFFSNMKKNIQKTRI